MPSSIGGHLLYIELQRRRSGEQWRATTVENEKGRAEVIHKLVAAAPLCIWTMEL